MCIKEFIDYVPFIIVVSLITILIIVECVVNSNRGDGW